jgi:hypothetical protein
MMGKDKSKAWFMRENGFVDFVFRINGDGEIIPSGEFMYFDEKGNASRNNKYFPVGRVITYRELGDASNGNLNRVYKVASTEEAFSKLKEKGLAYESSRINYVGLGVLD